MAWSSKFITWGQIDITLKYVGICKWVRQLQGTPPLEASKLAEGVPHPYTNLTPTRPSQTTIVNSFQEQELLAAACLISINFEFESYIKEPSLNCLKERGRDTIYPTMLLSPSASDFVLTVQLPADKSKQQLDSIVKQLRDNKFTTTTRPGSDPDTEALLFVALTDVLLVDLVENDKIKNYEFGVTGINSTPTERLRIAYSFLTNPKECGGVGVTPGKGDWSAVSSILPITGYLKDSTAEITAKKNLLSPKLDTSVFRRTYGTEVALYFEFLKYYIASLAFLSVFGFIAHIRSKNYSLTFAFVNLIWGTVFIILWKRRERYVVNFWGVQNAHQIDEYDAEVTNLNASFNGKSTIKQRNRREGVRFAKKVAFVPVALAFVTVLVTYQLACFVLEIFLAEIYDGPGKSFVTLIPTVLISVFVPVLTIVYNLVVDKFLTWEGHDNSYDRNDSFVLKTFVLNFLTGYVPLLITSFVYLPFAHLISPNLPHIQQTIAQNIKSSRYVYKYLIKLKSQEDFIMNQERLNGQFFFFMVTNQVIQVVLKYVLPLILSPIIKFVTKKIKGDKKPVVNSDALEEKVWLDTVRKTLELPTYCVTDDFRGLALQYGYLILYGPVWTLAPIASLVFNIITFKLDELKLANGKYFRPPVPKRVDSIHPWDIAFLALTWIGSVVSPLVTSFYRHGTQPPKPLGQLAFDKASVNASSSVLLVLTFFASEHLFFAIYFFGTKLSNMLKSEKEVANDPIDDDLKLRRDNYYAKVKSSLPSLGRKEPATVPVETIETSLKSAFEKSEQLGSQLKSRVKGSDAEGEDTIRRELSQKLEKGDRIINTIDASGKPSLAIIDNNEHFSPEESEKVEEITEAKVDTAAQEVRPSVDDDLQSLALSVLKKASKKKSLKKLLKRK